MYVISLFFSLDVYKIFFLSLFLGNVIILYTIVLLFMIIHLELALPSWICGSIVITKFGKIMAIISSTFFIHSFFLIRKWHVCKTIWCCSTGHWCSVHFFKSFFCLCFIWDCLLYNVFKFADFFFFHRLVCLLLIPFNVLSFETF